MLRPRSVVWAGRVCLFVGLGILAMQSWMTSKGLVDLASWVQGVIYLLAALFIYGMPRKRTSYVLGGLALVFITIRLFTTMAYRHYHSRTPPDDLWATMAAGVVMSVPLVWLTMRFICGAPARAYYRID